MRLVNASHATPATPTTPNGRLTGIPESSPAKKTPSIKVSSFEKSVLKLLKKMIKV